jgi:hypothetical protein
MIDKSNLFLGIAIGLVIGMLIVMGVSQPNKAIIMRGCAHYNTITGDFEWNKKRINKKVETNNLLEDENIILFDKTKDFKHYDIECRLYKTTRDCE